MILPREPLWLGLFLAVAPCFAQDQPKPKKDVHPAVLIYKVSPDYPDSWKREGIQGVVHLRATLTKEGTVRDVKVIDGIPVLAKSAEAAFRQWRYKPTTVDGVPVDVQTDVAITFSLIPAKLEAKSEHENSKAEISLPQEVAWTDPGTGLMWTKEDNGSRINWNEANQYCRDMKVKDYSDWRLPTIEELSGIFDKTQNVGGYHIKGGIHLSLCCEWSSSTGLDSNQRLLLHFMGGGRVSGRLDYTFPVLCVRIEKGSGRTINSTQTERPHPSTEQSTSTANVDLARLARQANGLSADQASRLEESLIQDPNNLAARAQLLGYYFAASPRLNPETLHEARVRHILWLVQNQPESELAGMSEATIDPAEGGSLADPAGYEKVKALWLEQVKAYPDKVMLLVNASWFFKLPDKAIASDLLTRAHTIDPGNQNASAGLGIVYAAAIVGLTGMNQNRFPTETKPEEAVSPFAQKAREELNKSQDAEVIGTAGYYLNFWGSILSAQGKTPTDYEGLAEKCLTKAQTLNPGNPEWARDLASLYKLRAMKAKSTEARAQPEATTPQAKSSSEPDATSNVRSLATDFLKYPAVASCSKKDCTIIVTNFVLPDGNTSPYGMRLADELSKELASQNRKIQVIDRGLLQDFLAKDRVPAKSINAGVVRSIVFALKARFVVVGTTERTDDNIVQLSTRLLDVADKNGSGYSAVVVNLLAPKSSVDLSPSEPFAALPPITSTSGGEPSSRPGVDGVSLPPKCAYMPNPSYSEEARKFQLSGSILVDAVINSEGKFENVRIIRGLPDGLNDATLATMKTWRCNPALKDGKSVPSRVQFEVNFNFRPN